jgi:hypothetical protein
VFAESFGVQIRRWAPAIALAITAALGVAYLFVEPKTADLAAATFRADLWDAHGFVLVNEAWYSGHSVPGYSLLYPPLGALVGPAVVLFASALAATACFSALAARGFGRDAWPGVIWFGLAATVAMWGGRVPFALGLALGLAALLALQRERTWLACLLAALTPAASPVAGLFLALAGAAAALGGRARLWPDVATPPRSPVVAPLAVAFVAIAVTGALGVVFPTPGWEPFRFSMYLWLAGAALVLFLAVPAERAAIRWGAVLYLLLGTAMFLIHTPVGDNAVRLGYTFAGPLLAMALISTRPRLLLLLSLPLLYWQWTATVHDVARGLDSPLAEASYAAPLVREIEALADGRSVRVEIPPTRTRWEAVHVAEQVPLARGWLRQLESDDFDLFFGDELDAAGYHDWLTRHGISYVALTRGSELDYLAWKEADLLEYGYLPYLREVWSNDDWTLWEVLGANGKPLEPGAPLATDGATVLDLGPDGYSVDVDEPGDYVLRIRPEPWQQVVAGDACIEGSGDGDSSVLHVGGEGPQVIRVENRLSVDGLLGGDGDCP